MTLVDHLKEISIQIERVVDDFGVVSNQFMSDDVIESLLSPEPFSASTFLSVSPEFVKLSGDIRILKTSIVNFSRVINDSDRLISQDVQNSIVRVIDVNTRAARVIHYGMVVKYEEKIILNKHLRKFQVYMNAYEKCLLELNACFIQYNTRNPTAQLNSRISVDVSPLSN
jgi:hypothetical protein